MPKTVVITGASRGIGRATASEFLDHGWDVLGTSTSGHGWNHERVSWFELDLASPESIKSAAKQITARGKIDVLINNAGITDNEDRDKISVPVLRRILEVNLVGTIDLTEQMAPAMNSGGHIILLGSGLGSIAGVTTAFAPAYSISKAALTMYTRKLASRLEDRKVTVSIVSPGWVQTDMGGKSAPRQPEEAAEEIFRLATQDVPTGQFWHQGKRTAW